jgi:hypothetical protein
VSGSEWLLVWHHFTQNCLAQFFAGRPAFGFFLKIRSYLGFRSTIA